MSDNKTKKQLIDACKFEELIRASGLPCDLKQGWVKVKGKGPHRVYVPRSNRVGRVDVAFPIPETEGVRALGGESFGAVTHQLDFTRTEDEILSTFAGVLDVLAQQEPVAKPAAEKAAKSAAPKPIGWSEGIRQKKVAELSGEELAKRKALIAAEAERQGVAVATSTSSLGE
jgi:hypothetical protein